MKKIISFALLLACLTGCKKKTDLLYGTVHVYGRITDQVSGEPIPNTIVYLYSVKQFKGLIGYSADRDEIVAEDTTDVDGYYSFTTEAKRQYGYELEAEPLSPNYVNSGFTVGKQTKVSKTGDNEVNLDCNRSAFARVMINNTGNRDTVYSASLTGIAETISLQSFYTDTIVYLKLVGRPEFDNHIRFTINNKTDVTRVIRIKPWDTVSLQFNY